MSIIIKSGSSGNLANVDTLGNFFVLATPAALNNTAAAWSSGTTINTVFALLTTGGYPAIAVQLDQTSTLTAGAGTFEGTYDGINWVSIPTAQIINPNTFVALSNPFTFVAATNSPFLILVQGYQQIRFRLSTLISGTGTVTPFWTLLSTNPFAGNTSIAGTVAVAGAAASGSAKSGNPVQVGAVFNTTQPTVTTGQAVENQATARGGLIVSTGVDTFNVTVNAALPAGTNVIGHVITDSGSTTVVTGTVAVTQSGTWSTRTQDGAGTAITSTGGALDINLKTSSITLPVSLTSTTVTGTVAVTQSTSPWIVAGAAASGAAKSGNPVQMGGVFNTTQPTVTTGQAVEAQSTARGAQIVSTGVDTFNVTVNTPLPAGTNVIGHVITDSGSTTVVTGTVAVTQSTSPWVVSLTSTTITGTVAVTQSTTPWTVQGDSASGAAKAGNPVQIGGVFNTTQPTVTTGQTVESQATARGAMIVATGVDAFAVNATLSAETTKVIGTVNQGTSPWVVSLTSTTITGTVAVTQSTSPWVTNMTQWASTALGVPTNFGTTPGAVVAGSVNSSVFIGTTVATAAAAGIQKVGISGATAATLDSTVAAGTAPANGIAVIGQYNTTIPTPTAAQTVAIQLDSTASLYVNAEGRKTTYRVGVVAFTPIASATAPAISVTGSGTKTVRILRMRITVSAATGGAADVSLRRFSALSGGTANTQAANVAKMDTNNAAQTAVVNQWSVAASTATSAGILNAERYEIVTAAVSVLPGAVEWDFGDKNGQGLVLRGTSDFVGILLSSIATTPVADCWVEWTEE